MRIRPVGDVLIHADRRERTDKMTKQIVAFRNFANASNNTAFANRCFKRVNMVAKSAY
jgi:hypothetical protein